MPETLFTIIMAKNFFIQDLSGHGSTVTHDYNDLIRFFEYEEDYDGELLEYWAESAEVGDIFESATLKVTRIE